MDIDPILLPLFCGTFSRSHDLDRTPPWYGADSRPSWPPWAPCHGSHWWISWGKWLNNCRNLWRFLERKNYQRCPWLQRVMCLCLILQFLKISIVCFHPLIFCCQLQETGGTTPRGGCNSLRRGREHLPGEDFWLPRYVFGTSLTRQPNGMQVMLSMCGLAWFHWRTEDQPGIESDSRIPVLNCPKLVAI